MNAATQGNLDDYFSGSPVRTTLNLNCFRDSGRSTASNATWRANRPQHSSGRKRGCGRCPRKQIDMRIILVPRPQTRMIQKPWLLASSCMTYTRYYIPYIPIPHAIHIYIYMYIRYTTYSYTVYAPTWSCGTLCDDAEQPPPDRHPCYFSALENRLELTLRRFCRESRAP